MGDRQFEIDERGKTVFEEFIQAVRPDAQLSWRREESREIRIVLMQRLGKKRILLEISQEAFDQAVDDPASRPGLAREVEQQLRLAESGSGIGLVKERR
jgi:hypothetical protein